jgi:ribonuclease-3
MTGPANDGLLEARLGHQFATPALLAQALTHRSHAGRDNERLEFLGDAVLGLAIGEELYRRLPLAEEGELTRLRASLVDAESLAEIAAGLEIGDHLRLGTGELKSGGYRRPSILADALEAIIGAVYLEGGLETARALVLRLYSARLASLPTKPVKDPKTRLQEWLQSRGHELPQYTLEAVWGEPHAQTFRAGCTVAAMSLTATGEGASRRRAEQEAAVALISLLEAQGQRP